MAPDRVAEAREIASNPDVLALLREFKKSAGQIRRLEDEISQHEKAVAGLSQFIFEKQQAAEVLPTIADEIERICETYADNIARHRRFRSLKGFARALAGLATAARNVTAIESLAMSMIEAGER